jgi:hypothetical protein
MHAGRILPAVVISLAAGFAIGYWVRPDRPVAPSSVPSVSAPLPAAPREQPVAGEKTVAPSADLARREVDRGVTRQQQLDALRSFHAAGAPLRVNLLRGHGVDQAMTKILGLSTTEQARIVEAAADAEAAITAARGARATSRLSEDGKLLIVEVPGLDAAASGAVYDRFSAALRATLDDDRFVLLNELAGESLERSFDRFGLNNIRYELTLQPKTVAAGVAFFDYKRHFVDAGGASNGWSGGTLTLENMQKNEPLLARFIAVKEIREVRPPKGRRRRQGRRAHAVRGSALAGKYSGSVTEASRSADTESTEERQS